MKAAVTDDEVIVCCKLTAEALVLLSFIRQLVAMFWNVISIDLHVLRPPEMQTPHYFIMCILGLAPTVSVPIQTHPYSGHLATNL